MKSQPTHRDITRLCIHCAQLLLQYGEESYVVSDLSSRLGIMLGMDSVESFVSLDAIVLTTISNGECFTTTRKIVEQGINMYAVTTIHHTIVLLEHKLIDFHEVKKRIDEILPISYPRWIVAIFIGFSCACFCMLNGGSWDVAIVSFCAAMIAMYSRLIMAHNHIHPLINFSITAFIATSVSDLILTQVHYHNPSSVAMAASLLLLVPGFPLINSLSDMLKGNVNTGICRWISVSLLVLSTSIGVTVSLFIFGGNGWMPYTLPY